jgi:filamentous hemagglutinin family protein
MNCNRLKSGILSSVGLACLWVGCSETAIGLPTGGTVAGGDITIGDPSSIPNQLTIRQTSEKGIIDWTHFNTAVGESITFIQPSPMAITLNRVLDGNPTIYSGMLNANGNIWIINPAGILLGKEARIDVGGFLGATGSLANHDFMSGHYRFTQAKNVPLSAVINEGLVTVREGGIACLVAPAAHNKGIIQANFGAVNLGSGTQFTFDPYGDGLINFVPAAAPLLHRALAPDGSVLNDAVLNSGEIIANSGKVWLTTSDAKQVVENVINMTGVIKANTAVVGKQGAIFLYGAGENGVVRVSGTLEAKGAYAGQKGGKITATGKKVMLFGSAVMDVSGVSGGGTILVGGDYKGEGILPKADQTYITTGARLRADSLQGEGGRIVMWSKKHTRFQGMASTVGKENRGGEIEISCSPGQLEYLLSRVPIEGGGTVLSINAGIGGRVVFDPLNISISQGDSNHISVWGENPRIWTPNAPGATISVKDIEVLLSEGINLIISTNVEGDQSGSINWFEGAFLSFEGMVPVTFSLVANANITMEPGSGIMDSSGVLSVSLSTPGSFTSHTSVSVQIAALSVSAGSFYMGNTPSEPTAWVGNDATGASIHLNTPPASANLYLFNGHDLFVAPTPSNNTPTTNLPPTIITEVLSPGNFPSPPSPPNKEAPPIETSPAPSPTPPSETPSIGTPSEAPSITPEVTVAPPSTMPPSETGGSPVIDGKEQVSNAEGTLGEEGIVEDSFNIEGAEATEEVAASCDCKANNLSAEECSPDPTSHQCLNEKQGPVQPSEFAHTLEDKTAPVGPNGVEGVDIPVGAAGIGDPLFAQESITSVEGAEGKEGIAEGLAEFNENEDIDRSNEYLENIGPVRNSLQKKHSIRHFFSSILSILNGA